MTRKEAQALGLHKYFSDAPCKRGHDPWRYAGTGRCVGCKGMYRTGIHRVAPINWVIVEERVHVQDLAQFREYCQGIRDNREKLNRRGLS